MAAEITCDSQVFVLYDNWPGTASLNQDVPLGGFTGSTHHNVATAIYPVGTKICVYNTGVTAGIAGFATFIYLQHGTRDTVVTSAERQGVVPQSAATWYIVSNDPDTNINVPGGLFAIQLSLMTSDYYGWYWCGGVCPEEFVSALGGAYKTIAATVAGAFMAQALTSAVYIGFGPLAAATDEAIGYLLINAA